MYAQYCVCGRSAGDLKEGKTTIVGVRMLGEDFTIVGEFELVHKVELSTWTGWGRASETEGCYEQQ